jgi:hypothetical protein
MAAPEPELRFHALEKYFYRGSERLPGLLHLLADRFYPDYDYTKAKHNLVHTNETEYKQRQKTKQDIESKVRERGIKIGIRFDKEMVQTIALLNQHPDVLPCVFWKASYLKKHPELRSTFKTMCDSLMPQTKGFWRRMNELSLLPVDAQVCVGKWYATAIDVVCVNLKGEHVLIEAKCGFSGYYRKCTANMMRAPLQTQTDSLFNQWQLQLAAAKELYQATFPNEVVGQCLVVRMDGMQASCYKLKPWVKAVASWSELIFPNGAGFPPISFSSKLDKQRQMHMKRKAAESSGESHKKKQKQKHSNKRTSHI